MIEKRDLERIEHVMRMGNESGCAWMVGGFGKEGQDGR